MVCDGCGHSGERVGEVHPAGFKDGGRVAHRGCDRDRSAVSIAAGDTLRHVAECRDRGCDGVRYRGGAPQEVDRAALRQHPLDLGFRHGVK